MNTNELTEADLTCPRCDNALKPLRITAERFICDCCSSEFTRDQVLTYLQGK